jgi:hypothetical protein
MGLNLKRTAAAIDAYDKVDGEVGRVMNLARADRGNPDCLDGLFEERERLAEAVGAAYGEDTKGLNDPVTCRAMIRPGSKVPPLGAEESFVRRMVRLWREEK